MRLTGLLRKHQGDVTTILEIHHMASPVRRHSGRNTST
jgi:hypothetical protein